LCASHNAFAINLPFFLPYPKIDSGRWYVAHGWSNGSIQSCEWRKQALSGGENNTLKLTLSDKGGKVSPTSCAEMATTVKYGYGSYAARIRAAKGSGLNTAFFTYVGPAQKSPVHEEIDFEFLGKDTRMVQLNYYLNGKPQGATFIKLDYDASEEFHDYTFVWEPKKIRWYIDKKLVHETPDGAIIPTRPQHIFVTLWSGSHQVDEWLGPFEYKNDVTAEFEWVKYTALH
jgi:endo-1,3-1,4-beta-glycanase ExoK